MTAGPLLPVVLTIPPPPTSPYPAPHPYPPLPLSFPFAFPSPSLSLPNNSCPDGSAANSGRVSGRVQEDGSVAISGSSRGGDSQCRYMRQSCESLSEETLYLSPHPPSLPSLLTLSPYPSALSAGLSHSYQTIIPVSVLLKTWRGWRGSGMMYVRVSAIPSRDYQQRELRG